jgi:hypothetical protein
MLCRNWSAPTTAPVSDAIAISAGLMPGLRAMVFAGANATKGRWMATRNHVDQRTAPSGNPAGGEGPPGPDNDALLMVP